MFNLKLALLVTFLAVTMLYSQNPTLNENSIKFQSSQNASLAGENGLIMKTTNNGYTWVEMNTNISNTLFGLASGNGVMLASGESGVILRSLDNGTTWDPILPGTLENLNDVDISGSNAVVCGNDGVIYYSTDSGENWNEVQSITTKDLKDVKFTPTGTGFITGELGTLLKSNDGGRTWNSIDLSFTNGNFNSVAAIDDDHLIIVGNEGTIFMSDNGGVSWSGPNTQMYDNNFNDVVFFNQNEGIIAADNGLMLRTTDGGTTWQASTVNVSGSLYDFQSVAFYGNKSGITVGTEGIEVYTTDGGATWVENPDIMNRIEGSDNPVITSRSYPNPFNPSTSINYSLPNNAKVVLTVFDVTGKTVKELYNGYQSSGEHTVMFDATGLSSGAYFYRISVSSGNDNFTETKKIILTK